MSYAKNKVTFWDETPGIPEYQKATGKPLPASGTLNNLINRAGLYYKTDGVFNTQEELDSYPHWEGATLGDIKFIDYNHDNVIDADDRVRSNKNQTPRLVTGFNVNLEWKGLELIMLWQAAFGAETYVQTWSGTVGNFLKEYYKERWTPENWKSEHPRTYERENQYWISFRRTLRTCSPSTTFLEIRRTLLPASTIILRENISILEFLSLSK